MIRTIEQIIQGQLYCFCNSGTDNDNTGGSTHPGRPGGEAKERGPRDTDRGIDSRGNTVNYNVDRSQPSVETEQGRVYGTQAQLDEKFGPSEPDTSIPGVSFLPGGGLPTMAQMSGYAGAYSPTHLGGYGTSAPDVGTATGMGGLGIADMIDASNRGYDNFTTGAGWARPPVYDATSSGQKLAKPGVVGVGKFGGFRTPDAQMARDMALMSGERYAGRITDVPDKQFGDFLGVDTEKGAYTVTEGRIPGSTMEVSRVTGEEVLAEQFVGAMGLPATALLGTSPDFARIESLETGEEGTYTDVGGIAGILGGSGGKASFGEPEPTLGGDDGGHPRTVASTQPYVPISTRFRSIQQFDPIRSMRFPRAPRPEYGAVRPMFAALGGYVGDPEKFADGVKNRKRGYHAFNMGGEVYGVAPDERNPGQFIPYGGSLDDVKNAMGRTYGYEPQSIDLNKFPGEEGFGVDTTESLKMQAGGVAGFVGTRPENVDDQTTIADDVPMDVPEGTFVINGAAVEFAGSSDIEKMLKEAMDKAQALGVDISNTNGKMSSEETVPLAVSAGEVIVPPVLAKIIGYDRLEKINNRGKQEVARRQKEAEDTPNRPSLDNQMGALGGRIDKNNGGVARQNKTVDEYDIFSKNLLNVVEGSIEEPHVPTSNSGVTIGRGVDLSRFLPEELARMGVNEDVVEKARPFLATGVGEYGPTGSTAKEKMQTADFTFDDAQNLSDSVYSYKKQQFEKDFPQFKEALPKDRAMAFSAYYVAGKKGMEDRYKTFLKTYEQTGDIVKSMDEGFLKILDPGDTEYNRALNALNWYFTADDADLAMKSAGEQETYTKSMIEAFRRKEELESAPAGFIPPRSRGKI